MFNICFFCQIPCVCLHFHPIPLERAWNMNRIGHFGDSLPSLPVSHFIFLWFSTCESIFTYFAQFWPLALGEAQTSSSPNWCNVIVSRHLCWDTCPHYKLNFSHHFSKKQLLLMWSCRYSPQHQSLVTSLCPKSRPKQWFSHARTHMMRREGKKTETV